MTKAVLLLNLGTPQTPMPFAVARYLTEFLSDPRVIDISPLGRWLLVNLIIVPFRTRRSAHAYQQIWQSRGEMGSPLKLHTAAIAESLQKKLGADYVVRYAMRYGKPSIREVIKDLNACGELTVIPLFPQYASASTGSALEEVYKAIQGEWNQPALRVINNFYDQPQFIQAFAHNIRQATQNKQVDCILFSYHGLPERQITKSHCVANCDHAAACPAIDLNNHYCYRAQCYATSRALAAELDLSANEYRVAFQSRLGRTPWIKPYTDLLLPDLIKQGVRNIAIVCPSFVADCLETLEEINLRAREQWLNLGGNEFTFIPCINDSPIFIDGLANLLNSP